MRLSFVTPAFLGLVAFSVSVLGADSNLALFGAPRHNLDGVLPVLDIEEQYIRSQTDGSVKAIGATHLQCSVGSPCLDGSCCNSQGQCGYRDEHCKVSCVANCDAKAPCGVNSENGQQSCFCGASEAFCRDTTESGVSTPCQQDFGKCGSVRAQATPTCGKDSGTASRRVAYYEGWNTRRRPCDKVWPANIDTAGLTHLIFSFATINPTTYAVEPMHPDDEKLYTDFLELKDGSKKWIGIGGWEFSDAGVTRHTWSQMAGSKASRGAFITSLLKFLDKWPFQGVDIDWEWPGAESRGGNPAIDKQNQVDLIKELREALKSHGLAVVLPAQYEYLKNIDPKALESNVDFMTVLAYDLHGPWDATIPGLGPLVKPHTDLKEIDTALDLFWFSDITPAKINLGTANYGRGYTLADESCAHYGCTWTGPSKPGECTELSGILSQCEIQRIISHKQLKPEIVDGGAGVKQIIFDDQWIGYDDNETLGLKTQLANSRCLGGTALWAIDYASCGGGNGPGSPGSPKPSSSAPLSSDSSVSAVPSSASGSLMQPPVSPTSLESVSMSSASTSTLFTSEVPAIPSHASGSSFQVQPSVSATSLVSVSMTLTPEFSTASLATDASPTSSTPEPSATETSTSAVSSSDIVSSSSWSSGVSFTLPPEQSSTASSPSASKSWSSEAVTVSSKPTMSWMTTGSSASTSEPLSSGNSSILPPAHSPSASSSSTSGTWSTEGSAISSVPPTLWVPPNPSVSAPGTSPSGNVSFWTPVPLSSTSSGTAPETWSFDVSSIWSPVQSSPNQSSVWSTTDPSYSRIGRTETSSDAIPIDTSTSSSRRRPVSIVTSWLTFTEIDPLPTTTSDENIFPSVSSGDWIVDPSLSSTQPTAWDPSLTWPFGPSGEPPQSTLPPPPSAMPTGMINGTFWPFPIGPGTSTITPPPLFPTSSLAQTQDEDLSTIETRTTTDKDGHNTIIIVTVPVDDKTKSKGPGKSTKGGDDDDHDGTKKPAKPSGIPVPKPSGIPVPKPSAKPVPKPSIKPVPKPSVKPVPKPSAKPVPKPSVKPVPKPSGKPVPDPPGGRLMKGCVPNDCIAECAAWYVITYFALKRPMCPCIPVTCKPDDDDDDWTDDDSDGEDDDCKFFGCGCGWEGIGFGPGCDVDFDLPGLFPIGLFNGNPCAFFGACPPDQRNPDPDPCGPLGCNGYCQLERGCEPCPPEICGKGPQCTLPGGCGPKPGPNPSPPPTRPTKCEKAQETTVTEKFVYCTEDIMLEPTTIASLNFTLSTTVTSTCVTPVLVTRTGCGLLGTTTTTTISTFTTTSSEGPACTRAPLDLNNDEGDNEQPPRTSDAPTCSRAPLSLDDDEGDNEQPASCTRAPLLLDDDEGDNEQPASCTRAPLLLDDDEGDNAQPTSSDAPACTRAPLSLEDDEGNNEMPSELLSSLISANSTKFTSMPTPTFNSSRTASLTSMLLTSASVNSSRTASFTGSTGFSFHNTSTPSASRVPPPSTLSGSVTIPWGTGIPSATPKPSCSACDSMLTNCVKKHCKPDGPDPVKCAKYCLADLCYGSDSPSYCQQGLCRHPACPKEKPKDFSNAEPGASFDLSVTWASTTLRLSATPVYSTVSLSLSPTPTCDPNHTIAPDAKWTALIEHQIKDTWPYNATLSWTLWDEHGCHAGQGSSWNQYGFNVSSDIAALGRTPDYSMGYALHTNVTRSRNARNSEIEFSVSKPVDGCEEECWVKWKVNKMDESKSWQITDDCAKQCGSPKLTMKDVSCDSGMNKWHDPGSTELQKRGGYCTWRLPFKPEKVEPPKPWTRDSRWTVEIEQWMEYEQSSIEWRLKDPNGDDAGHYWTDTSGKNKKPILINAQDRDDRPELQMRYKMLLTVLDPRKKETSQVRLTYQSDKYEICAPVSQEAPYETPDFSHHCQPYYQTESGDETLQSLFNDCSPKGTGTVLICPSPMINDRNAFSCDKVYDSFRPVGAGFQRKFKCWWPHDFAEPFGKGDKSASKASTIDYSGLNGTSKAFGVNGGVNGS